MLSGSVIFFSYHTDHETMHYVVRTLPRESYLPSDSKSPWQSEDAKFPRRHNTIPNIYKLSNVTNILYCVCYQESNTRLN
jgi:hypothetical protein